MRRLQSCNSNWKGGVCSITHVDELLDYPEYLEKKKQFILNSYEVVGKCWNWTGNCYKANGRARISIGSRSRTAASVSYVVFNKRPTNGLLTCHTCDNVLCVNPKHLWLGTNADNSKDMADKGRTKPQDGSLNCMAKLNEEKVLIIKKMLKLGMKQKEIAVIFEVTNGTINQISKNKIWRHV